MNFFSKLIEISQENQMDHNWKARNIRLYCMVIIVLLLKIPDN